MQVVQGDQSGKDPPLATPAADVWALGVIAYEVLCGMCMTNETGALCKLVIFSWHFLSSFHGIPGHCFYILPSHAHHLCKILHRISVHVLW